MARCQGPICTGCAEFGIRGGETNFRADVDAALDEIAAELDRLVGIERLMSISAVIGR